MTVLTQFEDLNLVNADATDETKFVTTKLSRTIAILSASADRPFKQVESQHFEDPRMPTTTAHVHI